MGFPDIEDSTLALFLELLRRGECEPRHAVWLVRDPAQAAARLAQRLGAQRAGECRFWKKNSVRGLWSFLRAKRIYFTHSHYRFVRRGRHPMRLINIWHGMPLKAVGLSDANNTMQIPASDLTVASSEFFRLVMSQAVGLPLNRVLVTGLPRCDRLIGASAAALALRQSLTATGKLVVWMPTFRFNTIGPGRADSSQGKEAATAQFINDMTRLSGLAQANRCVVVIKLHPMDYLNDETLPVVPGVTVLRWDAPVFESCGLYELLAVTDGLITDVSSVCFDFMATRRPILITRDFLGNYSRDLLFDPTKLFAAVFTSENWQGAERFFSAVDASSKLDGETLTKFCRFDDAGSSARLLDAIAALENVASAQDR
jgi:CDP-glycerol glycerophosphotransferase (TagB/SpsB family)